MALYLPLRKNPLTVAQFRRQSPYFRAVTRSFGAAYFGMLGFGSLEYYLIMRRLIQIAFAGWVALTMSMAQAFAFPGATGAGSYTPASSTSPDTSGYTKDDAKSEALTNYLKSHRLPLVGAQVLADASSGRHVVVLYGFVATDFGRADATTKANAFLHDPSAMIENRVKVDPEIASLPKTSHHHESNSNENSDNSADADASNAVPANDGQADADASAMPGAQDYANQQDQQSQIQQYQNQGNPLAATPGMSTGMSMGGMAPLVALLGLLSATNGGSSFSYGSSSPLGMFGPSNSYGSPNGPPYGSPYGSPYGGGGYPPPGAFPSSPYGSGSANGYPPPGYSPYP